MKPTYWWRAVLAALLVAAIAPAASAMGTLEVTAGLSKDDNYGSYSRNGTLGGAVAFGAGYYWSFAPKLNWGIDVALEDLGAADFSNPLSGDGQISAKVFRINPALRIDLSRPAGPSFFGQIGGGLYNVRTEIKLNAGGSTDGSDTKFGGNLGAGVSFPVAPRIRMNLLGQYHTVATDEKSTIYFAVRAGLGVSI